MFTDSQQTQLDLIYRDMCIHDNGSPHRIQHFTKVYTYAAFIARQEKLPHNLQYFIQAVAIIHDIGIRPAEEKYGRHDGPLQEAEGAILAKLLFTKHGFTVEQADRAAFIVGHHHTYSAVDNIDFQIILEADLLVNFEEHDTPKENVRSSVKKLFRTGSGLFLASKIFDLN